MSEPTKDEINRTLHEFMGNRPTHDWDGERKFDDEMRQCCACCGSIWTPANDGTLCRRFPYPAYTSSDSPRRLLEEVVAKVMLDAPQLMLTAMTIVVRTEVAPEIRKGMTGDEVHLTMYELLTKATAEQIATACYNVIKETP